MARDLQLWTWRLSPYAGKVRVAFAEKGVDVELLEVHPVRRPPVLKQANPFMRVPTLLVDGTPIRESSVICEWLEETHPDPPLWPADPEQRAWARAWAKYLDDQPTEGFFLGARKQSFGLSPGDPEDAVEQLHARVTKSWRRTEAVLGEHEGPWACGEQFTLVDVNAMALAVRLPEWGPHLAPDPGQWPLTAAWLDALRARPSAAAVDAAGDEVHAAPKDA